MITVRFRQGMGRNIWLSQMMGSGARQHEKLEEGALTTVTAWVHHLSSLPLLECLLGSSLSGLAFTWLW